VAKIKLCNDVFRYIIGGRHMNNEKMHKAFRERMENWDWSKIKG